MLKLACFLTGDQYRLVAVETPESRRKVIALAMAMMIPVIIWFYIGYMLTHTVLGNSAFLGLLAGFTTAVMIFVIEKLVIMAKGTRLLAVFRIGIGLLIAILGGIALDEVIFSKDIDNQIALIKAERVNLSKATADSLFRSQTDVATLDAQIQKSQTDYERLNQSAILEADGTSGTGAKGVGNVARLKNQKAEQQFAFLSQLQYKRDSIRQQSQLEITKAGQKAEASFDGNGLMTRIDAFFDLVFSKPGMAVMYIFVTLFFFFLEFLVIILKKSLPKTNYEKNLELIEQIGDQRRAFMASAQSALADPAYFMPEFKDARVSVRKDSPLFRLPRN